MSDRRQRGSDSKARHADSAIAAALAFFASFRDVAEIDYRAVPRADAARDPFGPPLEDAGAMRAGAHALRRGRLVRRTVKRASAVRQVGSRTPEKNEIAPRRSDSISIRPLRPESASRAPAACAQDDKKKPTPNDSMAPYDKRRTQKGKRFSPIKRFCPSCHSERRLPERRTFAERFAADQGARHW